MLITLGVGYALWLTHARLARSRPGFDVRRPLGLGFGLRLVAIVGISATGLDSALRGGDEETFLGLAQALARQPLGHGDFPHGPYQLHTVLFALQMKTGLLTVGAMRVTQVGLATLGVLLMLAAVNDLGGASAARYGAWLLAFEPTSIFFDSALHKEPLMQLAAGLMVYGGTRFWRKLDVRAIPICALGGLIAVWTRNYAGWFLISAGVLVMLHAALRNLDRPGRAMPVIYAVVIIGFLATPVILQASSSKSLQTLQTSQNSNTSLAGQSGNSLALEQVNFSTRGAILTNLPKRIRDLILKPYPWQLGDTSQRVGALGTLIAYAVFLLLIRYAWMSRGRVLPLIGPLLYPFLFMLIAYSLSAGNAGTGFRYRSHLVTLGIAAMSILRARVLTARAEARDQTGQGGATSAPETRRPLPSPV